MSTTSSRQKAFLCLLMMACSISLLAQQTPSENIVRNADIMSLTKAGLSDQAIIGVIRSSRTEFDLSAQALISLRNAGVSNAVIEEMLGVSKPSESGTAAAETHMRVPVPTTYGYYLVEDGQLRKVETVRVEAVVGLKGLAGSWAVDGLRGEPNFTVREPEPTFIFYQPPLAR